MWDLGYRLMNSAADVSKLYLPCWCPCHKQFKPYFANMNNCFLSSYANTECKKSMRPYRKPVDFKAHLHDTHHWAHDLILMYLREMYEVKPNQYSEHRIMPVPIGQTNNTQTSVLNLPAKKHNTKG